MLKAIFFDLDGTLADDNDSITDALNQACQVICSRWSELNPVDLAAVYRHASDMAWGDFDRYLRHLATPEAMLAAVWKQTLAHWNFHDPAVEEAAAGLYWQHRLCTCQAYPDAQPLLHRLTGRFHLSVLTNGAPAMQRAKLQATGLASFFQDVFVGGEFLRGKPDPSMFRAALEAAGCQPNEAIHIGDSLLHDISGARNIGIYSTWINRRGFVPTNSDPTPDFSITSLEQFVECLEQLGVED